MHDEAGTVSLSSVTAKCENGKKRFEQPEARKKKTTSGGCDAWKNV